MNDDAYNEELDRQYDRYLTKVGAKPQMYQRGDVAAKQSQIRRQAEATIERANRDIERAERKIAMIEQFGEDVYKEETVLCFYKKFRSGTQTYTYMAAKIAGKWYLTGPQQSGLYYDWGGLINFIISNALEEVEVWMVTDWERIV